MNPSHGRTPLVEGGSEKFIGCSRRYLALAQDLLARAMRHGGVRYSTTIRIDQFAAGVIGYLTDAHL